MAATSGTQISKPSNEQDFESHCVVLWQNILANPSVQKVGRRGQAQYGLDLWAYRQRNLKQIVGIQCKLKTGRAKLTATEVREEFKKALTFKPHLKEYFILTTADDDEVLQELARELSHEYLEKTGRSVEFYVWGWGTITEKAFAYVDALHAFDPTYGPQARQHNEKLDENIELTLKVSEVQTREFAALSSGINGLAASVGVIGAAFAASQPGGATSGSSEIEAHLDKEIDHYREIVTRGRPKTGMEFFRSLLVRVSHLASGRIIFRIKANIGSCLLTLGEDIEGAKLLLEAYDHAPSEPKAIANKALGLLLLHDWQGVLAMGRDNLRTDAAHDQISSYVIQAARYVGEITEPLKLVPEAHWNTSAVRVAYVDFVRARGAAADWWPLTRDALKQFPDDPYIRQVAAEAVLDEISTDRHFASIGVLTQSQLERVQHANESLRQIWESLPRGEIHFGPEKLAICGNLILGLRLAGDKVRAWTVAKDTIPLAGDDPDFMFRAAIAAFEAGAPEVDDLLSKAPESRDKKFIEFQLIMRRGEWKKLSGYADIVNDLPESDAELFATAIELAALISAPGDDAAVRLDKVADRVSGNIRAAVLTADFAMLLGHERIADTVFENALRLVDDKTHLSGRLMTAMHAVKREKWSTAADLLLGYVSVEQDSEELQKLSIALVSETPIRQRAVKFFEGLPPEVRSLPYYLHAEGYMHFHRRELGKAEKCFRKAAGTFRADNILMLINVLRRRGKSLDARKYVQSLDIEKIHGDSHQKMMVAQELFQAGRASEALSYGYLILAENRDDPQVGLKYTGLILLTANDRAIPNSQIVANDMWVKLEDDQGQLFSFIIEGGSDRPNEGILSPQHALASNSMGQIVGHQFTIRRGIGEDRVWTIRETQHKYLYAYHDIMEHFETRFPDTDGIYKFTMVGDDIQPILDKTKQISEQNRKFADLYLKQNIPLNMVAAHINSDVVSFSEYVRSLGSKITSCIGLHSERVEALKTIHSHKAAGAVLDTYAAWTAATLDIFDILISVLGNLIVPETVKDELLTLLGDEVYEESRSMTIAWHDGEFYKYERTAEVFENRRSYIRGQIDKIEAACQLRPVTAPDKTNEIGIQLTQMFGAHVLDAAALAAEKYILVSEDMHYRNYAKAVWPIEAVWLHSILWYARQAGIISLKRYANEVVKLANCGQTFLALDGELLIEIFGNGSLSDWERFSVAIQHIGTANADLPSHTDVVLEFVRRLKSIEGVSIHNKERALGMLLERLTSHAGDHWPVVIWYVAKETRFSGYIEGWVKGHFLERQQVIELQQAHLRDNALATARIIRLSLKSVVHAIELHRTRVAVRKGASTFFSNVKV